MNRLQSWRSFHHPERRFHQRAYRLQTAAELVNRLNAQRQYLQHEIAAITEKSSRCSECGGACCQQGAYSHFTVVDVLLRLFSDSPVIGYGLLWQPPSLPHLLWDALAPHPPTADTSKGVHAPCPQLGAEGCTLAPEDRPIRCILWSCRAFRQSLAAEDLKNLAELTQKLERLTEETVKIWRE